MKITQACLLFMILIAHLGCSTPSTRPPEESGVDYPTLIEDSTQNTKLYDGFMNTLDMSGTLLTTPVLLAQVQQNSKIYQWPTETLQIERSKAESQLQKESTLFLSFFTPDRKHDDLSRPNSKWKIFLDVKGRRYEGRAEKQKLLLVEAQALYPHHTRWQSAYQLTFPVAMTLIEKDEIKLTLTGPVGSASLVYPPAH